jgi:hypothetical protein
MHIYIWCTPLCKVNKKNTLDGFEWLQGFVTRDDTKIIGGGGGGVISCPDFYREKKSVRTEIPAPVPVRP